jgi:hypothetical protein
MTGEEFLSLADSHYEELETIRDSLTFYDYEKAMEGLMHKLVAECMEKQLGEGSVTKDRRKKNACPIR